MAETRGIASTPETTAAVHPDQTLSEANRANISKIVNDPAYLPADRDLGLIEDDVSRGLRLQLEYLKTDWYLTKHGIDHTIVVFGSTRIHEPAVSARKVTDARRELEKNPSDPSLQRQLKIAERSQENSRFYDIAREFGRLVGQAPDGDKKTRLYVMSGGGPGIMEAAHRGADDVGAESVGLNILLPFEQLPNPYITPGLCFNFRYFALRKLHFMRRARALVAFPGGYGTLDELFETLTLVTTKKIPSLPIVLVGEAYWKRVIDVEFLVGEGVLTEEESKLFWYCETAEEIWNSILHWYEVQGHGLFNVRAE